jgi:DNA polymerase-3 subunit alpha
VVASTINDASPRIRFGLKAIKNVGLGVVKAIIKERKENGAYKNLEDLLYRVHDKDLNKKSLESLIKTGTLDNLGERGQMLANLDTLLQYNKYAKKDDGSNQTTLFSLTKQQAPKLYMKDSEPTPENIKLIWEKELLGLYITSHPLKSLTLFLQKTNVKEIRQLTTSLNSPISIVGVVDKVKRIITKKNESMVFATMEDYTGSVEVIVFPSLYKTTRNIWQEGNALLIKGKISNKDNEIKVLAEEARQLDLEQIKRTYASIATTMAVDQTKIAQTSLQITHKNNHVYLELPIRTKQKFIEELKKIFNAHPGEHKVLVVVKQNKRLKQIATNFSISYNEAVRKKIELIYAEYNA